MVDGNTSAIPAQTTTLKLSPEDKEAFVKRAVDKKQELADIGTICSTLEAEFNTVMDMKDTVTDRWFRITIMESALEYRDRIMELRVSVKWNKGYCWTDKDKATVDKVTREVAELSEDIGRASQKQDRD